MLSIPIRIIKIIDQALIRQTKKAAFYISDFQICCSNFMKGLKTLKGN